MVQIPTIPEDPAALLTRQQTAEALTAAGYVISPKTLDTMASRGGGPRFRRFGKRALYCWADALAWATDRLSEPMGSTAEADRAA